LPGKTSRGFFVFTAGNYCLSKFIFYISTYAVEQKIIKKRNKNEKNKKSHS